MARLLHAILLPLLILAFAQCATGPEPVPQDVTVEGDPDSALAVALRAAGRVDDIFTQAFLYTQIANAYNDAGLLLPASNVLDRSLDIAEREDVGAARAEILVQVAGQYRALDRINRTRELLREALSLTRTIEDESVRVLVLQQIISEAFRADEELFDVLVETLDHVYVVEHLPSRVDLLVDVARQYQESGLGQQVNTLVQQAIAAATGITNPWQKAAAYSTIARRLYVAGNQTQADLYVSRSLQEIEGVQVLTRSPGEAVELLAIADDFAAIGRFEEAETVLETVEFTSIRARGLSELGSRYLAQDMPEEADRVFDEAVNIVALEGTDAQFADIVSEIANRFALAGRPADALSNAEVALVLVAEVDDEFTRTQVLSRLAEVFVSIERLDLAVEAVEELDSRAEAATLYASLSRELLSVTQVDDALRFIRPALTAAEEAEGNTDAIYRDIASLLSQLGRFDDAITVIDRISTAFAQGQALVELGRYSLIAGGLPDEQQARLNTLASQLAGEPGRIAPAAAAQ